MDKMTIVCVLGAPGAGKGTQCDLIVKKYGWNHISAGDLLRQEAHSGTELVRCGPGGQQLEKIMAAGDMVSNELMLRLLVQAMTRSGSTRFLLDGYPRDMAELKEFQSQVKPFDGALVFTLPEEVAVERLIARGATSGRVDDNAATIRERMVVFRSESQPVIDALVRCGANVHVVSSDVPVGEVFAAVEPFMEKLDALAEARDKGRTSGPVSAH